MLEKKDTTKVEETVEEKVKETVSTPEVKAGEKTFTEEQVNSMLKNQREKERAKAEKAIASNEELTKRLEKIEEERANEKAKAEETAKIAKEIADSSKREGLKSYIDSKVNASNVDSILKLSLLDAKPEDNLETLKAIADKVIEGFPGVEKTSVPAGSTLNKAAENPVVKEEETDTGYYTKAGTKLDISDEEYSKMSFAQKQVIVKK